MDHIQNDVSIAGDISHWGLIEILDVQHLEAKTRYLASLHPWACEVRLRQGGLGGVSGPKGYRGTLEVSADKGRNDSKCPSPEPSTDFLDL